MGVIWGDLKGSSFRVFLSWGMGTRGHGRHGDIGKRERSAGFALKEWNVAKVAL